jgi:hypothetical protein
VNTNPLADTKNDKKSPATKLKSKTGGASIPPGSTATIQVRNPTGAVSAPVQYSRPR